jgi:outer membrane protein assembly factor BamB
VASGRSAASGWLVAALIVVIVVTSTGLWNPWPGIWDWINTSATLSDPPPKWQERLGGRPKAVMAAENMVLVEQRESVEGRTLVGGVRLWQQPADWAAIAGPAGRTVVVTGKLLTKGYTVLDPRTGNQIRKDDKALAVWTYANAMIDVFCHGPQDCILTAREPASGDELWHVQLTGVGFVLFADNPELTGVHRLAGDGGPDDLDGPGRMPPLLGFPVNGTVEVVDTVAGRLLGTVKPSRHEKILVMAGRVVHSEATPISGGCEMHLVGRDPNTGRVVWQRDGYNLGTISGAACDQDRDAGGAGSALYATRPDGRQVLLDAGDGRELLVAPPGAKILASDGVRAVLRSRDGKTLTAYQLGEAEPLWSRPADPKATAAVARTNILVFDKNPERLWVLDQDGKVILESHSSARAVALVAQGVLVGDRRDLGLVQFPGTEIPNPVLPQQSPRGDGQMPGGHRNPDVG